jgi:hypothetical protein
LYEWVLEQHGPNLGPVADDVGVVRWVNLYATGDYVGRWLWSRAPHGEYPVTQIDQTSALGDTYTPHQVDTTDWSALMGTIRKRWPALSMPCWHPESAGGRQRAASACRHSGAGREFTPAK